MPWRCSSTAPPSGSAEHGPPHLRPLHQAVSHRRLIGKLLVGVAAALRFGFALVPLYDVLCAATGFNGKTEGGPKGVGGFARGLAPARLNLLHALIAAGR